MTSAVGGAILVVCAVGFAAAVAVSDRVLASGGWGGWEYPPVVWPLVAMLAGAGVVAAMPHRWARAAALLAAVVAAQLAGIGLIAVRSLFSVSRYTGSGAVTVTPVTYAAAVTAAAAAAAVAAAAMVWRAPAGWRSFVPVRPAHVVAGVAVVALLPQLWRASGFSGDITGLGHIATFAYAVPWGAGLASVGWMRGRSALAAGVTVSVSGVALALFGMAVLVAAHLSPPPDSD